MKPTYPGAIYDFDDRPPRPNRLRISAGSYTVEVPDTPQGRTFQNLVLLGVPFEQAFTEYRALHIISKSE